MTLTQLVERARHGDREAFGELWNGHMREVVFKTVAAAGLQRADVEDAVSATCLQTLQNIAQLKDPTRVAAWACKVALRIAQSMKRPRALRQVHYGLEPERQEAHRPAGAEALRNAGALVEIWIRSRLPMPTRYVCTRLLLDGKSRSLVSRELRISLARVDFYLLVGVEQLREWGRDEGWDDDPMLSDLL